MEKYELTPAQNKDLEQMFVSMTQREGWEMKFREMNEKFAQLAKFCAIRTPATPEQQLAFRKLQEAQMWFEASIKKNEF